MGTDPHKLKAYGASRSNELRGLGLSTAETNAWWQLKYKKKVTPKQFAYLLFDKELKWDMISASTCKHDLQMLGFPLLHLSFPMAMNTVQVICSLKGVALVKAHVLTTYLRTSVDADANLDGSWTFK